jgi:hypothetical protein
MRVVITSPPKTGNRWLKCLLSRIYDLDVLHGKEKPPTKPDRFQAWAAEKFPDGAIFHQHCRYTSQLCDVIDAIPAHHVTIIRDPYDVFVSMYYWVQAQSVHRAGRVREKRPKNQIAGKSLNDPDVLEFLGSEFEVSLARAEGWLRSGRTVMLRYEGLRRDPMAELTRATDAIAPVDPQRIEQAIEDCRAENMRQRGKQSQWHVSAAQVGEVREGLGEAHLAIFRERYADLIRALDYEVR